LNGKQFLVGANLTLADINLFFTARNYYSFVFVEDLRKKAYPHLTAWFERIAALESTNYAIGKVHLCKVPLKQVKFEVPKKEQPKKEQPKKEEKPKEEKKEEKPKNPLDLIESPFNIDDFKRFFLNAPDKKEAIKTLWETFDDKAWSIWRIQYDKLPSEGKDLLKTRNLCSMYLQKFDSLRKYALGYHGIYGEEGNYEVQGTWLWKGTEVCPDFLSNPSSEYYKVKKLDPKNPEDRQLLEDYWLKNEEGDIVDGLKVAQVYSFK
jgi:elongation factor 1-gamma